MRLGIDADRVVRLGDGMLLLIPRESEKIVSLVQGMVISEISSWGGPGALTFFCLGVVIGLYLRKILHREEPASPKSPKSEREDSAGHVHKDGPEAPVG